MATGLDMDLIVGIRMGLCGERDPYDAAKRVRVFQVPFDQLFDRLKNREFDMIAAAISTGEPLIGREDIIYSYPYVQSALVLAVRGEVPSDCPAVRTRQGQSAGERGDTVAACLSGFVDGLRTNKATVVERSSKSEDVAKLLGLTPIPADAGNEFAVANATSVNVILNDKDVLQYEIRHGYREWKIFQRGDEKPLLIFRGGNSVAVRKQDANLLGEINRVINTLLSEDVIAGWQEYWSGYVRGTEPSPPHVALEVHKVPFWDRELKRSKADLRMQPLILETINGSVNRKVTSLNPSVSWLFPTEAKFLTYLRMTDLGAQYAYVYKRRIDTGFFGANREEGWDVSLTSVWNFGLLMDRLHLKALTYIKPQIAVGLGHRHVDSEYAPGDARPGTVVSTVSVVGISLPVTPTFHGLGLTLDYKHASTGAVFNGSTVDQTLALGMSYVYPH